MSLLHIYKSEVSDEFKSFLDQIKPSIKAYAKAKQTAQKERMLIIGKIAEYKSLFPQRSSDHRLLVKAMKAEVWSDDVISNNLAAYKQYLWLINNDSSWHPLAEASTVSHLLVMGREEGCSLSYYAAKYLKSHKELPSVSAMRGHLAGWFDEKFRPKNIQRIKKDSSTELDEIEIEIRSSPSKTEVELIEDTQVFLRDQLLKTLSQLNMEEAFINENFKEDLKANNYQLELLADWSKAKKFVPIHL